MHQSQKNANTNKNDSDLRWLAGQRAVEQWTALASMNLLSGFGVSLHSCLPESEENKCLFPSCLPKLVWASLWQHPYWKPQHPNWKPAGRIFGKYYWTEFSRVSTEKCRKGGDDAGMTRNNLHADCGDTEEETWGICPTLGDDIEERRGILSANLPNHINIWNLRCHRKTWKP